MMWDNNESQSLYLLGKKSDHPSLKRYSELMNRCIKEGEFLSFKENPDWLACYAGDAQPTYSKLPLLVFRPHSTSHIAPFLHACHQMNIPVTTRCGGTGFSGCCVPSKEGVVLLTSHLNQIKNYDPQNGTMSIEPGVTPRQLNQCVAQEGWRFPLSLATEGTAGIAGCISCHSRGYHQQEQSTYSVVEQVTLVDGKGEFLNVPYSLVCGAEGLWGVIIEMKLRLKKQPQQIKQFRYPGSLEEVLKELSALRSIQTLTAVIGINNQFYFQLEGEKWRLPGSVAYLSQCFPEIEQEDQSVDMIGKKFLSSRRHSVVISSVFRPSQLPHAVNWSIEQALTLQLECLHMTDLLAGSLHLILQSEDDLYQFTKKMEQYLVLWTDFVDRQQGILSSTHGIGMQLRHYMPPFWTEESQSIWRHLQAIFDPQQLFGRERFFPVTGKSIEKCL